MEAILAASEIDLGSEPARIVAKIIGYGPDRSFTLERLCCAIGQTGSESVANKLSFHAAVLADPEFVTGGVDTTYVPRLLERQRLGQGVNRACLASKSSRRRYGMEIRVSGRRSG